MLRLLRHVSQHRNIMLREVAAELVQKSTGPQPASVGRVGGHVSASAETGGLGRWWVAAGPFSPGQTGIHGVTVALVEVGQPPGGSSVRRLVAFNCCPYVVFVAGLAFARP